MRRFLDKFAKEFGIYFCFRSRDALRKHIAYKHTEGKYSTRIKNTSSSLSSSPEDDKVATNAAT